MQVAQKYQDKLAHIKDRVRNAHDYFNDNYKRHNEFVKFVFESTLTNDEVTMLQSENKPQLQFNIVESRISRLLGEMSKQEPDILVTSDNQFENDWMTLKVVEAHLRHLFLDIDNHHTRYLVYKDVLAGGFGVLKVFTDYANPMSMDQVIKIERAEPTLCVFDKLAQYPHKGDGLFCAQLFPKSKEEFQEEYPDVPINTISFRRDFGGFNWSYINDNSQVLLMADYYEKNRKETKIVRVRDDNNPLGKVMTYDKYKKMVDEWNDITVPPTTIGKSRKTMLDTIERFRLIDNQIIEHETTDYSMLPLIFVDGSSSMVKNPSNGDVRQVCRPYVYNAKGAQRLKNYSGICLANELENESQAKLIVAKEALPKEPDFREAYENPQHANVYVFNSVHEANPELPINNPIREYQRPQAPAEIMAAFQGSDAVVEQILGTYDAALGINDNQLSGTAIIEAATQSNSAAMPYVVGFMQGLQRAAQVYVDLLPKYYSTPRTLPIIDEEGKRQFVEINTQRGLPFDFDTNALNVVVKAGASFQVQKSRTINMVKEMMGMSQEFASFISSKGLNFVLDNMEGKGIEQLKEMVKNWQQEQEQMKQQAQQMQQQEMMNNPAVMKMQVDMARLQHEKEKDAMQHQLDMMKLELEKVKLEYDKEISEKQAYVQLVKADTERVVHHEELQLKKHDMVHKHHHENHKRNLNA